MRLSIIVAVDQQNGIGKAGKLLCKLPEDLERFKAITSGHPVIMGRKTFSEDVGRCLPDRSNIIVTRDKRYEVEGGFVAHSLEEAIRLAEGMPGSEEVFVIGGGQLFEQALPLVSRLYLTKIEAVFDADTFFPDHSEFTKELLKEVGESGGYKYTFTILERRGTEARTDSANNCP